MEDLREDISARADCAKCDFASDSLCSVFAANGYVSALQPGRDSSDQALQSLSTAVRVQRVGSLVFSVVPSGGQISDAFVGLGASDTNGWFLIYQRTSYTDRRNDCRAVASTVEFRSASSLETGWNPGGDIMIVHFPRVTFRGLETHVEAICAGIADFGASALLSAYLESLWNGLAKLTESEQAVVEAVTNKLVRSCIMRVQDSILSSSAASRSKLEAAKQYIDERITQPSLTVESIQNWLGVSRRQLYSLFESYGGVARYIMSQRLKRCHVAINNPEEQRPLGRIAEQYGIDPIRVVNLFRQEFGYGPDQVRSGVRYGQAGAVIAEDTAPHAVCAA